LAVRSCAATPRQSAEPASCSSIFNTRIWSAVGFDAVPAPACAATHSPLCPAFRALIWQQQRERVRVEVCVCLSVCVCARVRMCTSHTLTHSFSHIRVCAHLAVFGAVGGGLASSAHEWLLQRLAAVIAERGIAAAAAVALARCVLLLLLSPGRRAPDVLVVTYEPVLGTEPSTRQWWI